MSIFDFSTPDADLIALQQQYADAIQGLAGECAELNKIRAAFVQKNRGLKPEDLYIEHNTRTRRRRGLAWVRPAKRAGLPVPTFRQLVLAGGGGKGLVYPSVYAVLQAAGFMEDINAIAGSSAGALTAAAIACGADPLEIADATRKARYLGMMIKGGKRYGVPEAPRLSTCALGLDSGQEIYEMFRHLYLTTVRGKAAAEIGKLPPLVKAGKVTQHDADAAIALVEGRDDTLTFRKLATLHAAAPGTFKELTITGTRIKNSGLLFKLKRVTSAIADYVELLRGLKFVPTLYEGTDLEAVYFSNHGSPDMEIALAARISMSLPFLFDPVDYNGALHVDGGVTTNVPLEVFFADAAKDRDIWGRMDGQERFERKQALDQILVVVPANEGEADSARNMLTSRSNQADSSLLKEELFGVRTESLRADWEKVYNATERNVLVIPHPELSTQSFLTEKAPAICTAQIAALHATVDFLKKAVNRKTLKSPDESHRRS